MNTTRIEQAERFCREVETEDFGPLEDVHEFVVMHCQDNASDVEESEVYNCLRSTLAMYIDDTQAAEVFEAYRN